MNLMLWLYLVDVAGSLKNYFGWGVFIFFALTGVAALAGMALADTSSTTDKEWRTWRWCFGGASATFIVSTFFYLALPSNQTLYLMIGARTAEEVVHNPAVEKIGAKVMAIVDKKLDELAGEKPKESK